jgi:hypothetical protein
MTLTQADVEHIQAIIKPMFGFKPGKILLNSGSFLAIDCGKQRRYGDRYGDKWTRYEWSIFITHAAWRLQTETQVITSCEDARDKLTVKIRALLGRALLAAEIAAPVLDTTLTFEGGLALRLFATYSRPYLNSRLHNHWMLFTPNGKALVIGPGSEWSYDNQDEARPLDY